MTEITDGVKGVSRVSDQAHEWAKSLKKGDLVIVERTSFGEKTMSRSMIKSMVTCHRQGKIYTDALGSPFDELNFLPTFEGHSVAPLGRYTFLRDKNHDFIRKPTRDELLEMKIAPEEVEKLIKYYGEG